MIPYQSAIVELYLRKLIDWDEYYALKTGPGADAKAERETLESVLATAAQICTELEPELRAGWTQAARLVEGRGRLPARTSRRPTTRSRRRASSSFGVAETYGGYGLPAWVANVILQMIARADAGLMTILGLQAGVADDIQTYGSDELKQRYLPGFAAGELMGAMDLTEPAGGLGPRRHPHARDRDGRRDPPRRREDLHHQRRRRRCTWCSPATPTATTRASARRTASRSTCARASCPTARRTRVEVTRLEEKLGIHGSPTAAVSVPRRARLARRQEGPGLPRHADAHEQRAPRRRGPGHRHRRGGPRLRGPLRPRAAPVRRADRRAAADEEPAGAHGDRPRRQPRAPLPRLRASSTATARSRRCSPAAASASRSAPSGRRSASATKCGSGC